MTKNGKQIKIIAFIMLFAIFLNLFSSFMPAQAVFADELEDEDVIIEMNEEDDPIQELDQDEAVKVLGNNADLLNLWVDEGTLTPSFNSNTTEYQIQVDNEVTSINITAIVDDPRASMRVNGTPQASGVGYNIGLNVGQNQINIEVLAEDGTSEKVYVINIERIEPAMLIQMASVNGSADEIVQVAAGNNHSLGLKGDGTVWAWGNNQNGSLGDGTNTQSETPVRVSGLTDIIAVAAGNGHSMVLKSDGTVWTWGKNDKGQLGNGMNPTNSNIPIQVSGLTNIKAIAAGHNHSMALRTDGTLWIWGENGSGRLGDNTTTQRNTPVQVLKGVTTSTDAYMQEVIAISAGKEHSVALREDGRVYTWGKAENGMLGNGTTSGSSSTPVQVRNLTNVKAISTQGDHTLALLENGTVRAWGNNGNGRLGDGTTNHRSEPVTVTGLADVDKISAGNNFSSALKKDGTVWTWGDNGKGQVGDGSVTQKHTPVQVHKGSSESTSQYLQDIVYISAGNNYVLAVNKNHTVWAWGDNGNGRLGDGTLTNQSTPVMNRLIIRSSNADLSNLTVGAGEIIPAFNSSITEYLVAVGNDVDSINIRATLADYKAIMRINGTARPSGTTCSINLNVGNNTVIIQALAEDKITQRTYTLTINRAASNVTVPQAPRNVTAVAERGQAIVNFEAPTSNGGSTITQYTVISIPGGISAVGAGNPITVTGLSNGTTYTFTVTATNTAGEGVASELSNSITPMANSNADLERIVLNGGMLTPVFDRNVIEYTTTVSHGVETIHITAISADEKATLQINDTQQINEMAYSQHLEVGANIVNIQVTAEDGITKKTYTLTLHRRGLIPGSAEEVLQVAAGNNHTIGLKGDGTVWAWGRNNHGQLGDGTIADSNNPVQVKDLTDVISIAAGNDHGIALRSDGTVWTWGRNDKGQLGNDSTVNSSSPIQVSSLSNITAIAGGNNYSMALRSDGAVWTWGDNTNGRLGIGTTSGQSNIPVQILKGVTSSSDAFIQGVSAIAAGNNHGVVLKDGKVYSWGQNSSGQLGNNSTTSNASPVEANSLSGVIAISTRGDHTLALTQNGSLWAWGKNDKGQLGDNSTSQRNRPTEITRIMDIAAISAGNNFSIALKTDGTVWAWGNSENGRLGNGSTTGQSNVPIQVLKGESISTDAYLQDIIQISAGNGHTLAVKADHSLWAWGHNEYGRLGDGTTTNQSTPVMSLFMGQEVLEPELPEWNLEDDVEIDETYFRLPGNLSAFGIDLGFTLLENILDLLNPRYIAQPPVEEPQPPVQEPQPPVEELQPPIQEPQPPTVPIRDKEPSSSKDKAPANSSQQNQLVEIIDNKNEFRGQLNLQVLKEVVAQMANKSAIQVDIAKTNDKAQLSIGADSLNLLKDNKTSLVISTRETSYVIPHNLAAFDQLIKEKGNVQALNIIMEKAILPSSNSAEYKILANPVLFKVEAVFTNETIELKHFGNQYVERRIVLDRTVDPRKCVGVVWENNDWKPVPTTFIQENGKTVAVIKRNGNSIYAVIEHNKTFDDISNHWAKSNIELLASKKVVKGMEEGKFIPNNNVTRAQFVTMLIGSLGYKDDDRIIKPLKDVQVGSWYEKNVYAAMKLGIVTGYEDETFKPNKEITREEMAVMIAKTVQVLKGLNRSTTSTMIADRDQVSPWAQLATDVAIELEIMKGYADQSFKPKNKATRAEAVTVFKNMMEHLDFITY